MSLLAESKQIIGVPFQTFFYNFLTFWLFLNIQIDLMILKTHNQQFTLTTKNHCISSLKHD